MPDRAPTILEGKWVIVKNETSMNVVKAAQKGRLKMGRLSFDLASLIGLPYGVALEASEGKLTVVELQQKTEAVEIAAAAAVGEAGGAAAEHNRHLKMSDKGGEEKQKLTQEDIEALKEQGSKGVDIVGKVIENSATFKAKTVFSQEKYIKAKAKKYSNIVTVYRPTTRLLIQAYTAKNPEKLCYLRIDSLAGMLHRCNIRSGARVIVVEGSQGLLTGAVLARVGVAGTVLQLHQGEKPASTIVDNFNFPADVSANFWGFPLFGVAHIGAPPASQTVAVAEGAAAAPAKVDQPDESEMTAEKIEERAVRFRRRELRTAKLVQSSAFLERGEADALLIATKFEPLPILKATLKFLLPSRPFAVFSIHKDPLVECYSYLKSRGVIGLTLTERWTQEYQVLPERTHPHMMMHAAAGYVLSGTTTLRDTPGKAASSTKAAVAPTPKRSATAVDASSVPESSEAKRAKIDGV